MPEPRRSLGQILLTGVSFYLIISPILEGSAEINEVMKEVMKDE
jgi:hypothetical protein